MGVRNSGAFWKVERRLPRGRRTQDHVRLFRDDRVERLTFTPFPRFLAIWALVLGVAGTSVAISPGSAARRTAFVAMGLALWTLFEYVMHRSLFHLQPRSAVCKRLIFLLHGNHHADPHDRLRNVMPPGASLALAAIFWVAFRMLLGPEGNALFFGFASGYVAYDTTHFACHQTQMRGPMLAAIKRHHMRHHFVSHEGNYATTFILWDRVFRTRLESGRRR